MRFGANVQPGQIVAVSSEPGQGAAGPRDRRGRLRARGAKFVDLIVFDVHFKRARALNADPETLGFVPPWFGQRARGAGRASLRARRADRPGGAAAHGRTSIPRCSAATCCPRVRESIEVVNDAHHQLDDRPVPDAGVGHAGAPRARAGRRAGPAVERGRPRLPARRARSRRRLGRAAGPARPRRRDKLDELAARRAPLRGPGHRPDRRPAAQLAAGARPASITVDGIVHAPNIPTEEVFTTPDPERVDGFVTATKPLFTSGTPDHRPAGPLRGRPGGRDRRRPGRRGAAGPEPSATPARARLGEVALVDREGRIGPLDTVFFDTLLDENAASHIALGPGLRARRRRRPRTAARVNEQRDPRRLHDRRRRGGGHRACRADGTRGRAAARRPLADLADRLVSAR